MTQLLTGRVAIVSGAGGGIGRATATLMAREGAKVIVNDLGTTLSGDGADTRVADTVVAELKAEGLEATANTDSVSEWDSARAIVQTAIDAYGRVDIVVNNAGIVRDAMFHKMSVEQWDTVLKVHLDGTFNLSRAAAEQFRQQDSGAFVHITSTAGLIGGFGQANYAAAKMGIVGLSRTIAFDMARYHVRSNCVAPHAFSRMIESIQGQSEEQGAAWLEQRRNSTRPDHVAPLIAFLASDAAHDVTGQIFGARGNEIYLYSQPRPIRTLHRSDGWTPDKLAEQLVPAWGPTFTPMERSSAVLAWPAL